MATSDHPIRLVVQEPALAKYRVPVYQELARRDGLELKLVYGSLPDLPNVDPNGFEAELAPLSMRRFGGHPVYWHRAQWEYATRRHADVLILQWDVHYTSLVPALLRAKINRVPTILWGHGFSKHEARWRSALRNQIAKLGSALLFYNYSTAEKFIRNGWDSQRVFVAINSLDQSPIQHAREVWLNQPERLAQFQREHNMGAGPFVLYVSRLDRENRIDLVLHATAQLRTRFPEIEFVMIGKGDPEKVRLQGIASQLGITDRVRFLGAIYDETELAPWFLSADVFCYPANIGLSILHSFGYGLPVVTSDRIVSHNPEIEALRHGENGLLYSHENVESLAQMIEAIVGDRQTAERMRTAALETVQDDFSLAKMVDGLQAAVQYCWRKTCKQ